MADAPVTPIPTSAYPGFRQQFPQYVDLPDSDVVQAFQKRYYPDKPVEEVAKGFQDKYGVPQMPEMAVTAPKEGIVERIGRGTFDLLVKPMIEDAFAGPKALAQYFQQGLDPNATGQQDLALNERIPHEMLRTIGLAASMETSGLAGAGLKAAGRGAAIQALGSGAAAGATYDALTDDIHNPDYFNRLLYASAAGAAIGGAFHGVVKGIMRFAGKPAPKVPPSTPMPNELKVPMTETLPTPSQAKTPLWERMLTTEATPGALSTDPPPKPQMEVSPQEVADAAAKRAKFVAQRKAAKGAPGERALAQPEVRPQVGSATSAEPLPKSTQKGKLAGTDEFVKSVVSDVPELMRQFVKGKATSREVMEEITAKQQVFMEEGTKQALADALDSAKPQIKKLLPKNGVVKLAKGK